MPVFRRFGHALPAGGRTVPAGRLAALALGGLLAALLGLAVLAAPAAAATDHPDAQGSHPSDQRSHPSAQGTDVHIQVDPSTVEPGLRVEIRASCGDNVNPAKVRSRAFSEVTLTPGHGGGSLVSTVTVSTSVEPGEYRVRLSCANGSSAATDLIVLHMQRPTRGPDTGGGGLADDDAAGPAGSRVVPAVLAGGGAAALATAGVLVSRRRRAR